MNEPISDKIAGMEAKDTRSWQFYASTLGLLSALFCSFTAFSVTSSLGFLFLPAQFHAWTIPVSLVLGFVIVGIVLKSHLGWTLLKYDLGWSVLRFYLDLFKNVNAVETPEGEMVDRLGLRSKQIEFMSLHLGLMKSMVDTEDTFRFLLTKNALMSRSKGKMACFLVGAGSCLNLFPSRYNHPPDVSGVDERLLATDWDRAFGLSGLVFETQKDKSPKEGKLEF